MQILNPTVKGEGEQELASKWGIKANTGNKGILICT